MEAGPSTSGNSPPPVLASKRQVQKVVPFSGSTVHRADSDSSIDSEEREARAMQDEWERDLELGLVSIDWGDGETEVLHPGLVVAPRQGN